MEKPRLAVYGSLLSGVGAMRELGVEGCVRRIAPCTIAGVLYDLGAYPGLRPGDGSVAGELVELADASVLRVLDDYEGYDPRDRAGSLFVREWMGVAVSCSPARARPRGPSHAVGEAAREGSGARATAASAGAREDAAWVYIYNGTPDPACRVPSGSWRRHLDRRGRRPSS